jgi:hypothetical protein
MAVELMTAVEARFGVSIPVMALAEVRTIERMAQRIAKELKRGAEPAAGDPQAELGEQVRMLAAHHAGDVDPAKIAEIAAGLKVPAG